MNAQKLFPNLRQLVLDGLVGRNELGVPFGVFCRSRERLAVYFPGGIQWQGLQHRERGRNHVVR